MTDTVEQLDEDIRWPAGEYQTPDAEHAEKGAEVPAADQLVQSA